MTHISDIRDIVQRYCARALTVFHQGILFSVFHQGVFTRNFSSVWAKFGNNREKTIIFFYRDETTKIRYHPFCNLNITICIKI